MRFTALSGLILWLAVSGGPAVGLAQGLTATPVEPISALLEAFQRHSVVMLSDPHGRPDMQAFLLRLIRDPRLPAVVDDIVLEPASARYQDVLDRFVRGDTLDDEGVRRAWEDTTQPHATGVQTAELVRAIRAVNATLPAARRFRVLAGDPPIDWEHVTSRADHFRWIELRDTHPADLIRRQVLDRGRRALVVYGQMHAQRRQMASNYDMSSWMAQTIVSLLERDGATVFTVWTMFDEVDRVPQRLSAWPVPSLAHLRGTDLGAIDFARFIALPARFGILSGKPAQIPREQWRSLPIEEQFDALLYLGPASDATTVALPRELCEDARFMRTRAERIALAGLPQQEIDQLKQACR